jgi:hypothetical protein
MVSTFGDEKLLGDWSSATRRNAGSVGMPVRIFGSREGLDGATSIIQVASDADQVTDLQAVRKCVSNVVRARSCIIKGGLVGKGAVMNIGSDGAVIDDVDTIGGPGEGAADKVAVSTGPRSRADERGPAERKAPAMNCPTNAPAPKPLRLAFHNATVIAPEYRPLTFSELFGAVKGIAPSVQIGTWASPNLSSQPPDDPGVEMIVVEGHSLAVFAFDKPAPPETFRIGRLANIFMRDPALQCLGHKCHVNIMRTKAPQSRAEAVALSRAVTLVALAVAHVLDAIAVKWDDADHIVRPSIIEQALPMLVPPRGITPTLWARLLAYRGPKQPTGVVTLVVGTVGLHAFGLRDLEFAPSVKPPNDLLALSHAFCDYLLKSGAVLKDGETIGIPGYTGFGFRVAFKPRGYFLDTPICLLTPNT